VNAHIINGFHVRQPGLVTYAVNVDLMPPSDHSLSEFLKEDFLSSHMREVDLGEERQPQ
jgi:hypothetical protein